MDNLEKSVYYKIQDVVGKLQKMDCSLLGNRDDAWIMELLFQAGFHRYHLIEWILSKLDYNIKEISGPRNSEEGRMKNLQTAISDLGICRENSHNIVKGTAAMKEQLQFWCMLVNILWTKNQITSNLSLTETDEGFGLSETDGADMSEKNQRKYIHEEYEDATFCLKNIIESVNLEHLLKQDLQLVAPDVEREMNKLSTSEVEELFSLQQLKDQVNKNPPSYYKDVYKNIQSQNKIAVIATMNNGIAENEINQLENSMLESSTLVQDYAEGKFTDVCNELKPLILHASSEKFTDVGPHFQKAEQNLEKLLELKKSFPKLSSSHSKLVEINLELEMLPCNDKLVGSQAFNIANLLKED